MDMDAMKSLLTDAINNGDENVVALLDSLQHKEEAKAMCNKSDKKILVIGDVKFNEVQLTGFLKSVHISKNRLEFKSGYTTLKRKSIRSYQYNSDYALILVGAMPHSMKDMGAYSSLIVAMETEDGWPNIVRLGNNGLKGTFASAKRAIMDCLSSGIIVAA